MQEAYLSAWRGIGAFRVAVAARDLAHAHRDQRGLCAAAQPAGRDGRVPRRAAAGHRRRAGEPDEPTRRAARRCRDARAAASAARASHRRAAGAVPHRVHVARRRGAVGRGDRRVPRDSRRDGAQPRVPRTGACCASRSRAISTPLTIDAFSFAGERCDRIVAAVLQAVRIHRRRQRRGVAIVLTIHHEELHHEDVIACSGRHRHRVLVWRRCTGTRRRADRAHRRHGQPGRHRRRQARVDEGVTARKCRLSASRWSPTTPA